MARFRFLAMVVAASAALSACGGGSGSTVAATTTVSGTIEASATTTPITTTTGATTTVALRPADAVRAQEAASQASRGVVGQRATFGKLTVLVASMSAGGDDGGKWLAVQVRFENPGTEPADKPEFAVFCAENPKGGGWQAASTVAMYGTVPAASYDEGVLNLLLPGDSRTGSTAPECRGPAVMRAGRGGTAVDWEIPDDVLLALGGRPGDPTSSPAVPSTTPAEAPDDSDLVTQLLTLEEVPSGLSIDESPDEASDSTTEPAECVAINSGVDNIAAAGSAQVRFKQSTFGPFLVEVIARSKSISDAKKVMTSLDDLLARCGSYVSISADGTRTDTTLTAMSMKKFGDDTWAATLTSNGGFLPAGASLVAVRKGALVMLVFAAGIGATPTFLDEDLVGKAFAKLK